jgi:nanoRNase/pAp phosphatase (c-di-AMP/oligoRNAs hydrolase)
MATESRDDESEGISPSNGTTLVSETHLEKSTHGQELISLLKEREGENHLVILQGTPDPDAISSAMALQFLGTLYDIETTILCFVKPSHQENRALVKRLGIDLLVYDENKMDWSDYSAYSIVDSQKYYTPVDNYLEENEITFLAFVDHHREDITTPPHAKFIDIRPYVSSTASILCEYLQLAFPKGLEPADAEHTKLATALMHGIRSDTQKLVSATRLEYKAAQFIAPCVDTNVIEMIERQVLTASMLGILENALVRRRVHDNFIFSDVGYVRASDRDGIPQAAELLLQREGTDTVLVVGVVDDKTIDGSLRTRSETISPDEFLKGFLGASPENGLYYGGGNIKDRGGFQIPLGFLGRHEDKDQVYAMGLEVIEKSFLDYIGRRPVQE